MKLKKFKKIVKTVNYAVNEADIAFEKTESGSLIASAHNKTIARWDKSSGLTVLGQRVTKKRLIVLLLEAII